MESLKALSKELQSNAEWEEEQKILKLIPFSLALSMFIHELTEPKTKKEAESMFPNLLKDFGVSMGDSPEIETMSLMFERLSRDFVGDE